MDVSKMSWNRHTQTQQRFAISLVCKDCSFLIKKRAIPSMSETLEKGNSKTVTFTLSNLFSRTLIYFWVLLFCRWLLCTLIKKINLMIIPLSYIYSLIYLWINIFICLFILLFIHYFFISLKIQLRNNHCYH